MLASPPAMPLLSSLPCIILPLLLILVPSARCLSPQAPPSQSVISCGLDCSCSPPLPPSTPHFSICGAACCPPASACADTSTSPPICLSSVQCALNSSSSFSTCTSALLASRSLAEKYEGYLHSDELSSPFLLQQLEASAPELFTAIKNCNSLRRSCNFACTY